MWFIHSHQLVLARPSIHEPTHITSQPTLLEQLVRMGSQKQWRLNYLSKHQGHHQLPSPTSCRWGFMQCMSDCWSVLHVVLIQMSALIKLRDFIKVCSWLVSMSVRIFFYLSLICSLHNMQFTPNFYNNKQESKLNTCYAFSTNIGCKDLFHSSHSSFTAIPHL